MADFFQPRPVFETRKISPSSLAQSDTIRQFMPHPVPQVTREHKLCSKMEEGGTGSVKFKDEDGQELGTINWRNGRMLTNGDLTIEAGKDDSSSA